ncbi:hypothetical protein Nepgr_027094 [Nepenthes gracilis]|uniref:Glycosyltransferase n=1 Tax=Nepenthes gracilis TaxID=150966 RepID=A0AAD3TAV4_NEPGR|nr:hypothetical protein Nepgr_027094 [Nepenthes gracilis]
MVIPSKSHVALLASPGFGHLIPVIELAKRLVTVHSFSATVFVVTTNPSPAESQLLQSAASANLFDIAVLPHVNLTFPPETDIVTRMAVMMREALPSLHSSIAGMTHRPTALIVDLFGTEAIKIADEFDMLKYVFIASNALFLAFTVYFPFMGKIEKDEPLILPGCNPVPFENLNEIAFHPEAQGYQEYIRIGLEIPTANGVIVNTWEDLEGKTLCSFKSNEIMKAVIKIPVHAIGPLVRRAPSADSKSAVIEWLDMQPNESVVYVSFGSGGTLTTQQTIEMAWGLELSQQRFIWVVRPPIDYDASASLYFESKDDKSDGGGISRYLPDGFLARTSDLGRVVPMWAPQEEILAHPATGGCISHCGWNSTLECLVHGIPIIGWPLYAEQNMNATMLTRDIGVAIRPTGQPSKVTVGREEIEKMVRKIMVDKEGATIRLKAKELQKSGEKVSSKGGSSYDALSEIVKECEMNTLSQKAKFDIVP